MRDLPAVDRKQNKSQLSKTLIIKPLRYPTIKNFLIKVIIRVGHFYAFIDGPHHLGGAHQQMFLKISQGLSNFKMEPSQVLTQNVVLRRFYVELTL